MSARRRRCLGSVLFLVGLASVFLASACGGEPPEKEIQQAQGALDAARAAGAEQYARDEFAAAQDALKQAHAAVDDRDYRQALNHALDAREQAQNAARDAADRKATARSDAERALGTAAETAEKAKVRLREAEAARVASATLGEVRRTIADGDDAVQKARAAFQRGDYLGVLDGLIAPTVRLREAIHQLDVAPTSPPRRRREPVGRN